MESDIKFVPSSRSHLSINTLDAYNPYDYREGMGHLSNCQAWIHLVKCSLGTGVLAIPKAFKHAGLIPGLIMGIFIGKFCVYCIHILIDSIVHIAARFRQPYIAFSLTMEYTFEQGYPICQPIRKCIKGITDAILVGSHFGTCVAYVNYMVQTTLTVSGYEEHAEGYNWETVYTTLAWIPFLSLVNCIRNLKLLYPVSTVGNILTFISMGIIIYCIFTPTLNDDKAWRNWEYFGNPSSMPLFIGIMLFSLEAFGVIIAVERDMKTPANFVKPFGVFNTAMMLVISWYIFLGVVGYLRFGKDVKSSISLTITSKSWLTTSMKVMIGLSLYCSYPLQCFVVIDILWTQRILPKIKNRQLLWEFVFRIAVVLLSALCSLIIPKLDLIISLVGAVCLSFLGTMMPGLMEYNIAWSKYHMEWSWTMVKDIIIIFIGFVAFLFGVYGTLYGVLHPEE